MQMFIMKPNQIYSINTKVVFSIITSSLYFFTTNIVEKEEHTIWKIESSQTVSHKWGHVCAKIE